MRTIVRFETPDKNGETRRERNIRFFSPELNRDPEVPAGAEYLLDWFWSISSIRPNGFSGPDPILPSLIAEWSAATGNIVSRDEVMTLLAVDGAYRTALAAEYEQQRKQDDASR